MRRAFRLTFPFLFKEKVCCYIKCTYYLNYLYFVQANYVMKRKADGTTTIRVLMDNKASKNSALHRAIIETGRFEPKHRSSKANFCFRSIGDKYSQF